jgi:transposase
LSHARRKFFELATLKKAPIAIGAVRRIDELFAIEREINGLIASERLAVRHERSRRPHRSAQKWFTEERAKLSAKNPVAKAIHYSLIRWPAMTCFLDDGRICPSNNAAERALRGIAVGRHNWTFAGSDRGGERAAAIYTLIETCKLNNMDPRAWLADILRRLPGYPAPAGWPVSWPGTGKSPDHRPSRLRAPTLGLRRMLTKPGVAGG